MGVSDYAVSFAQSPLGGGGLGVRFLGHIERTAVLIHLLDATTDHPVKDWRVIRKELEAYGEGIEDKPELIVLNKVDALDPAARKVLAAKVKRATGQTPYLISAVSGEGVRDLLRAAHGKILERDRPRAEALAAEDWRP